MAPRLSSEPVAGALLPVDLGTAIGLRSERGVEDDAAPGGKARIARADCCLDSSLRHAPKPARAGRGRCRRNRWRAHGAICRSVVGETLPETTASRSTGAGARNSPMPPAPVRCAAHSAMRAYSMPDEPATKGRGLAHPPEFRADGSLRLRARRRRRGRSRRRRAQSSFDRLACVCPPARPRGRPAQIGRWSAARGGAADRTRASASPDDGSSPDGGRCGRSRP